jgi:uncharacterized protein VirK/YbjX
MSAMLTTTDDARLEQAVSMSSPMWRMLTSLSAYVQREWSERGPGGLWHVFVLYCGVLCRWSAHRDMVRVMSGPSTQAVRDAFPRLEYRYTLPYLSLHFQRKERYEMLKAHYALVNQMLTPDFARQVLADTLRVWQTEVDGHALSVVFKGHCLRTRHREGELTLAFTMDGVTLYELSFSLIRAASVKGVPKAWHNSTEHVAYLGRVQGAPGQYELIRQATKLCGEVAPPDLLMTAMAGLASALGINTLVGVDNESSISHENIRGAGTSFDYAEFWGRYNAVVADNGHAVIRLPYLEKPIAAIASRHRKRTLLKREYKKALADQSHQVLAGFLIKP